MANFVRDGIAMEIPEAQLALLSKCFDKADEKIEALQNTLAELGTVKYKKKKYLADNAILELLNKVGSMVAGMSGKKDAMPYEEEEVIADSLMAELEALQAQIAELKAKEEALMKELEMAQSDMANQEDMIAQKVRDRRDLERKVFKLLDMAEPEMEKMGDRQLKEALIIQRYNYTQDALQLKTNEQINAMFEIASLQSNLDKAQKHPIPETKIVDSTDTKHVLALAYKEYTDSVQNAWQIKN